MLRRHERREERREDRQEDREERRDDREERREERRERRRERRERGEASGSSSSSEGEDESAVLAAKLEQLKVEEEGLKTRIAEIDHSIAALSNERGELVAKLASVEEEKWKIAS